MRIRSTASGLTRLTGLVFLVALSCWALGITVPILKVTQFFIFEDEVSLIAMVFQLFESSNIALAMIVMIFTILLPAVKLLLGCYLWWGAEKESSKAQLGLSLLELMGKWAMVDVMVVAVLVVTMKTSWVASFTLSPGMYFFAASALLALMGGIGLRRAAMA